MKRISLGLLFACLTAGTAFGQKIADFQSVKPEPQKVQFVYPEETHRFQLLIKAGDQLTGGGTLPGHSDFTGYVPKSGSSVEGHLCVNSEWFPGDVTTFDLKFDSETKFWKVNASQSVNFTGTLQTTANCSGTVTPWETMVTCEEIAAGVDLNFDGLSDYGWCIEIEPGTNRVKDQNRDGSPDKLWALGCGKHENIVVAPDRKTVYWGVDDGDGVLFKFVTDSVDNLSSGKLYALKLTGNQISWMQVPNSTKSEQNKVVDYSRSNGAALFDRIEDVEVGPDGYIYFAITTAGVGRLKLDSDTSGIYEWYVENGTYPVETADGVVQTVFNSADNLAFDKEGNLWVLQDGGDNHIWTIMAGHTAQNPKVRVFGNTPLGCEPTGITFTPDGNYFFISFQYPTFTSNAAGQLDVLGQIVDFNRDATMVFGRKEQFGTNVTAVETRQNEKIYLYPNPANQLAVLEFDGATPENLELTNLIGQTVFAPVRLIADANKYEVSLADLPAGLYFLNFTVGGERLQRQLIKK